jgi:uncharacterized membrane-anchored protein
MTVAVHRAIAAAVARGNLPPAAALPAQDVRPWPVVLLTALGAWLAAIPLLGFFGAILGPFVMRSGGTYAVGVLALAASIVVLRSRTAPVFVEQLAVPGLLVGLGALGMGLYRDLPHQPASFVLLLACGVLVTLLHRAWLRVLLGAAAATLCVLLVLTKDAFHGAHAPLLPLWIALHTGLLAWAVAVWLQQAGRLGAPAALAAESAGAGWLLLVLAGLAGWSGITFLVGGSLGAFWGDVAREVAPRQRAVAGWPLLQAGSALLALLAAFLAARAWPLLRDARLAGVAAVGVALAAFLPALGGVLLALSLAATGSRWRLAGAAAFAAAWIVGSFYYSLAWPLALKAVVLVVAGAVLAALAWSAGTRPAASTVPAAFGGRRSAALVALGVAVTLAVANVAIWQKEDLIAHGDRVFVPLAPADPRSLMQGDFMQLNWALPADAEGQLEALVTRSRPHAVAVRDARGVARLTRITTAGSALAPGELRIELTPKNGRWLLVTDAWFFREGDAARWAAARYGEFRVGADGRALLVGMADAELRAIPVAP